MSPDVHAMTPAELATRVQGLGQPRFRAEQIFRWLHQHGASSWAEMTNVPKALKEALGAELAEQPLRLDVAQVARDGTRKLRFRTSDGRSIESVLIPEERERSEPVASAASSPRDPGAEAADAEDSDVAPSAARDKLTLCVSSQVGCALDCQFCATATLGFGRHLSVGEIVSQAYLATAEAGRRPSNLVFMGMGEPLHNFDAVARALALLAHPWGAGFSPRRITVSTAGLVPGIDKLGRLQPAPNLAISLNAATDEIRDRLMPINRKWPLAELLAAARRFPLAHGRKVTFEYVLLAGVNDSDADARQLPRLLRGLPSMVNLIPWNPFSGPAFTRPSAERIRAFQEILRNHDVQTYIRTPRGDDIDAACGQLAARAVAPDALVAATRLRAAPDHAHPTVDRPPGAAGPIVVGAGAGTAASS
jgi:23S rRNA (adenine2503-C2)-methyltransferase